MSNTNEASAPHPTIEVLNWARAIGEREFRAADDVLGRPIESPIVLTRDARGEQVAVDLEKYLDRPARIRCAEDFVSVNSFAEYVNEFATDATRLYGSIKHKAVIARIDDHATKQTGGDPQPIPSWRTHTAILLLTRSPEWEAILGIDNKWMSQTEFAEWIEIWSHVVSVPDEAALVEMALNLQGSVAGNFSARINRSNGNATFSYQQETVTNQVIVPTRLQFKVQLFRADSEPTMFVAHLNFRIKDGKPIFQVTLRNPDRVEELRLSDAFGRVETLTGRLVLIQP